jgi:hypothetical protein
VTALLLHAPEPEDFPMSRVERTENLRERSRQDESHNDQSRQAERGRTDSPSRQTPTKAEGELGDVEQALEHQEE